MKLNIRDLLFAFGAGYLYGRSVKRRELPRTRVNYNNLRSSKTWVDLYKENKIIKSNYSQPVGDLYKENKIIKSKYSQPVGDLYKENFESNYSQPVGDLHTGITRVDYDGLHLSKTEEELYTGNKIIKSNYSQHQANEMMKRKFDLDNGETR